MITFLCLDGKTNNESCAHFLQLGSYRLLGHITICPFQKKQQLQKQSFELMRVKNFTFLFIFFRTKKQAAQPNNPNFLIKNSFVQKSKTSKTRFHPTDVQFTKELRKYSERKKTKLLKTFEINDSLNSSQVLPDKCQRCFVSCILSLKVKKLVKRPRCRSYFYSIVNLGALLPGPEEVCEVFSLENALMHFSSSQLI